jgi:hypothetical protein
MSEETVTQEAPAKPAKVKAKKTKAAPAVNGKPRARKGGLRLPQVRILRAIKDRPLTRTKIIAKITQEGKATAIGFALGPVDKGRYTAYTAQCGYKSLLALGYVRPVVIDVDGKKETLYEATAAGKKAITAAK